MDNKNKFLVLDTNIILLNSENLLTLAEDATIVLPETVIYELDSFKSNLNELGYHSREFARIIAKMECEEIIHDENNDSVRIKLTYQDKKFMVMSKKKYKVSRDEDSYNDKKIIEIAEDLTRDLNSDVVFMSADAMCRFTAMAKGLNVKDLKIVEEVDTNFIKEIEIENAEVFRTLDKNMIKLVDDEYEQKFYNYKFKHPETGNQKLGIIVNGYIQIISKESANELRNPKFQPIAPVNCEQLMMSKAIQDPRIDVVVCEAKAGSGKTLTAVSNAMRLIDMKEYSGITYIRNSVNDEEPGEDIGYLAGNEEKLSMYLNPIHDQVDHIARQKLKASKLKGPELEAAVEEKVMELMSKYDIEAMITTGLRGRTLKNRVIIYDEWQNTSNGTSQKALTRAGENCKVIVIGSNRQIDNKYLTRFNNGLSTLLDACTNEQDENVTVYAIKLEKILRGPIASWSENLFSKK